MEGEGIDVKAQHKDKTMKHIYVLHEYGAPTHYLALQELADKNGYKVGYYELWKWNFIIKHPNQWKKYIVNRFFWAIVPFLPTSKIVLGIAPYNKRLPRIMRKLRKHEVYYHTSYTCWDGTRFAHAPKSDHAIDDWKGFTKHYVKHIFAVSEKCKSELVKNGFTSDENVSTVNHSYNYDVEPEANKGKSDSFIYVGRLIEEKGIKELLDFFASHPELKFTIVGAGPLEEEVKQYATQYGNIHYEGYISGFKHIAPHYQKHSFFVLNSKKNATWEELFGMTIIESMACGCVPICTNHSGPQEIITNGANGFLTEEGTIGDAIRNAAHISAEEYQELRGKAIQRGKEFQSQNIASKWAAILD